MIFNSAGHHLKDSGAVATHRGVVYKENEMAIMFRNGSSSHIRSKGYKVIEDDDKETLSQYLARIQPGSGSVTCEHHMNSFSSNTATGIEVVIGDNASKETVKLAGLLAVGIHRITGIPLRNKGTGVIKESQTPRGRLGLMREGGIVVLIEYGFISNPKDVAALMNNKDAIFKFVGDTLILADTWLI